MALRAQIECSEAQSLQELHKGIVVQLRGNGNSNGGLVETDRQLPHGDIERYVSAIETAGTTLDALASKCLRYEEDLRDFSRTVGALKFSLEDAHQKVARSVIEAQAANGRASRAEAEAAELRERIRAMTAREATSIVGLDRIMNAVHKNFALLEKGINPGFRHASEQ